MTFPQADSFIPHAAEFYDHVQAGCPLSRVAQSHVQLYVSSHNRPSSSILQNLLPGNTPSVIIKPRTAIHIFSSSDDALSFRVRSPKSYDWFMHEPPTSDSRHESSSEGWAAPHGIARVKGHCVDVVSFLVKSRAVFEGIGSFHTGHVAEEEVVREQQREPSMKWKNFTARSIVWAIGEDSPSLKWCTQPVISRNTNVGSSSNSSINIRSSRPLLRRTFGFITSLRCPGLSTLSSLHFGGKWLCPSSIPNVYLAGSSYSPSSSAAHDESPSIIASLRPLLPAPPQLIR
jgi:hypothetical protein